MTILQKHTNAHGRRGYPHYPQTAEVLSLSVNTIKSLLTVLAVAMALDYVSGVLVAALGRSLKSDGGHLESKAGFIGLAKKGFIIIIVLLATLLDRALGTDAMIFQTATVCYYITNEALSILENAGLMGLPVPSAVKKALEQMQRKSRADEE